MAHFSELTVVFGTYIEHILYISSVQHFSVLTIVLITVSAQIKEAVLTGIALDDEKREEFNKIEQVRFNSLTLINVSMFSDCLDLCLSQLLISQYY